MDIKKSQRKLSSYRAYILAKEGLNYSDYFDDNIPAEVKPPPDLLGPMEESDYPVQARDLFGNGLHENDSDIYGDYWIFPSGEMKKVVSHWGWAVGYLVNCNVNRDDLRSTGNTYEQMYKRGFIRFLTGPHPNIKNTPTAFIEYSESRPPTNQQWVTIKNLAIENHLKLYDDTHNKDIDLTESLRNSYKNKTNFTEGKRSKRIFILEHMMPQDTDTFKSHLAQLFQYLQKELQLKTVPKVKLLSDKGSYICSQINLF